MILNVFGCLIGRHASAPKVADKPPKREDGESYIELSVLGKKSVDTKALDEEDDEI